MNKQKTKKKKKPPLFANLSRHSHSIHLYTRNPFAAWYSTSSSLVLPLRFASGSHIVSVYPTHLMRYLSVTNLARQAPWRRRRYHSHPSRPVARPRFRCCSHSHPPRVGASTDLHHIAPVAISLTAGRSRPLSFVSIMLLARPSPVIVTYVVSC